MIRDRLRPVGALLLCSTLSLNLVNVAACNGSNPPPATQQGTPTANAGQSQDAKVGQAIKLDGSASKGASPADKLSYDWAFTSVPQGSKAALTPPDSVATTFTPDLPGAYVIALVVSSGGVTSQPSSVTITATAQKANAKPVASAIATPASPATGAVITLDGTKSSDADGDTLSYKWALTSAPKNSTAKLSDAAAPKPTFTADLAGDYAFTLTVNDGKIDSAPFPITVSAADPVIVKPTATATASKSSVAPGDSIDLDGSASKAATAGATLTYHWSVKSAPTGSTVAIAAADQVKPKLTAVKLDLAGTYEFSLVVNDGKQDSDPSVATVTAAVSAKPTATATASKTAAAPGDSIDLDGSTSKAAKAGATLTYLWSVKSAPTGSTVAIAAADKVKAKLTVRLDLAGTYEFSLVVNDGTLSSDPAVATVVATAVAAKPVAAIAAVSAATVNVATTLDGSASTPIKAGDTLTYAWTITAGQANATLTNGTTSKATFTATKAGSFTVQLIVDDGTVASAPVSVTFNAN